MKDRRDQYAERIVREVIMAMTTVLVQVDGTLEGRRAVEAAFLAARSENGHVMGVHVVPKSEKVTAETMLMSRSSLGGPGQNLYGALHRAEQEGGPEVQAARESFEEIAKRMNAEICDHPPGPGRRTACFKVVGEDGPDTVARLGRVFDLVVVRQPRNDPDQRLRKTLRSVLFQAGRPILVAPSEEVSTIGSRLVIAWSRSALSARAAAISRSFFSEVEEVGILSVATKSGSDSGPTASDLADYIGWHGIKAKVIDVELGNRRLGDRLLEEADGFGADLLVMGAYSHSPFRESLTGGVTNHVLSNAKLPLLMSH